MFKEAIRLAKPNIELSAEKATAMLYTLAVEACEQGARGGKAREDAGLGCLAALNGKPKLRR